MTSRKLPTVLTNVVLNFKNMIRFKTIIFTAFSIAVIIHEPAIQRFSDKKELYGRQNRGHQPRFHGKEAAMYGAWAFQL